MKRKINIRLGLISLFAIVMTAAGVTLVYYGLFQQQVRADLKQTARILTETGVFRETSEGGEADVKTLAQIRSGTLRVTWIDASGTVLFDSDTDAASMSNHGDRPEIREALETGEGESTRRSDTMNMDTFYYAVLLENGTVLRLSMQARTIANVLFASLPVVAVTAVIILMACVLIGHYLTGGLMRPLEEMAEDLDAIGGVAVYKELEPFARKIRTQHENVLAAAKNRQDFTANISHELKTPITAISGYAELIEKRLMDEESEAYIAKQIRHNADRLLSLITDSIRLSELDHSELSRSFESVELSALAQECVRDLQPMAEQKGVRLVCSGVPAAVSADPALIREMIDNLVQNAIRYNRENGEVRVETAVINGRPAISVKDTGIGIPADQQSRIFERFYRVDKSRSRQTGGTGLGLAIVKHIADLHAADILLKSAAGEGSDFTVLF